MDSNTVSIIGLSEIEGGLNLGEDYTIELQGTCNQINKTDNEDGSVTYKHKIKQKTAKIISNDGRQVIVKDKTRHSVKIRAILTAIALERGIDSEDFYNIVMGKLRANMMAVLDFLEVIDKH